MRNYAQRESAGLVILVTQIVCGERVNLEDTRVFDVWPG